MKAQWPPAEAMSSSVSGARVSLWKSVTGMMGSSAAVRMVAGTRNRARAPPANGSARSVLPSAGCRWIHSRAIGRPNGQRRHVHFPV